MGKDKGRKPIDLGGESTSTGGIPHKSAVQQQTPRSLIELEKYLKISSPILHSRESGMVQLNDVEAENAFALALEEAYQEIKKNRKWYSKAINALLTPIRFCRQRITGVEKKYSDLSTAEKNQLYNEMALL